MKSEDKQGFEQWLKDSYLPKEFKDALGTVEVVGDAVAILSGVGAIVGIVDLFIKLAELFDLGSRRPDRLQLLAEAVQRIETAVNSAATWNEDAHWIDTLKDLNAASSLLHQFINRTNVSAGTRPELLTDSARDDLLFHVIQDIRKVRFALLPAPDMGPPAYQESIFRRRPFDFGRWPYDLPEHDKEERVDAVALGITGLPPVPDPPPEWLGSTLENGLIWDHRRALPHILRTVTELVVAMKVFDPALRTTQRFRQEIQDIIRDLEIFAARWLSCIGWTHKLPLDPNFADSEFPRTHAPVAYDSRSRLILTFYTEFPNVTYWTPVPQEPVFSMSRMKYAKQVLAYSGFDDFRSWIDQLRELTTLPGESESIRPDSRIAGVRRFRGKSSFQRMGLMTPMKFFRVDWMVTIDLLLQPQKPPYDYARALPIRYAFFIESYETDGIGGDRPLGLIQRLPLRPGGEHILSIRVFSPTVFVPAEDDGSFGDTSHITTPPPEVLGLGKEPKSPVVQDFLKDAGSIFQDRARPTPSDPRLANPSFVALGQIASRLSATGVLVSERPPKAELLGGEFANVDIGCRLDFGPDIREGLVTFRAWSLRREGNAGSLYLVIEETPPADPSTRIRTLLPVYLNPDEFWYPAYSRRGPGLEP